MTVIAETANISCLLYIPTWDQKGSHLVDSWLIFFGILMFCINFKKGNIFKERRTTFILPKNT